MITLMYVMVGDIVIKCISGVCGVVSLNNLQIALALGSVELFIEVVGIVKIFKGK